MITITNGVDVVAVTNGAYEGVYKRQGFYPVKESAKAKAEPEQAEAEELVDLAEKPVSQWSKQELALFVEVNGLEEQTKGMKVNEMKTFVKEFMEKAEEPTDEDWDAIESEGE